MQKPPNLPTTEGVYAIVSLRTMSGEADGSRIAYVGHCANLRHRAAIWEYRFRQRTKSKKNKLPAKGLPDWPSDQWAFMDWPKGDIEETRRILEKHGFRIVNSATRIRGDITWAGKTQSLADHARDLSMPYTLVYYRWSRGKPLDEVFRK